jgi:hypothetical protein
MGVLTENALRNQKSIEALHEFEMLTGIQIFEGAIVCRDPSTGYATNGADTADFEVLGVASQGKDNTSGASGDEWIKCYVNRVHKFATSGATQAWLNKQVYVVDNNTVALTGTTNNIIAGTVTQIISATEVRVYVPGVADNGKNSSAATAFNVPLTSWVSHTADELTVAAVVGTFNRNLSSNALTLEGEEALSNTKTDSMHYHYTVPNNYEAGGVLTFRARAYIKGAGTIGATKTIDLEAYEQTDGAAGSDICATAVQTLTAAYANYDFTITPTGLAPGDVIMFKLTTAVQETAGTAIQSDIAWTKVICATV